jgi:hypothetical protein
VRERERRGEGGPHRVRECTSRVFYATAAFKLPPNGSGLPLRFKSKLLKPLEFKSQTKMANTNGLQWLTKRLNGLP